MGDITERTNQIRSTKIFHRISERTNARKNDTVCGEHYFLRRSNLGNHAGPFARSLYAEQVP